MQPPHPTVIAHGKLSSYVYFKFSPPRPNLKTVQSLTPPRLAHSFYPSGCFASGALVGRWCSFLLFEANETRMPRLRNLDTEPHSSYRYEVEPDNRLESVANAHTAADLHVRPVS